MKPALHLHAGQHMSMTPQLLQSIRLLQLSSLELEQELRQSLEQNVMLESDDGADDEEQVDAQELAERAQAESTEAEVTGSDAAASHPGRIGVEQAAFQPRRRRRQRTQPGQRPGRELLAVIRLHHASPNSPRTPASRARRLRRPRASKDSVASTLKPRISAASPLPRSS